MEIIVCKSHCKIKKTLQNIINNLLHGGLFFITLSIRGQGGLAQVGAKSVIESVSVLLPTCAKPLAQFWRFLFHFWRFGVPLSAAKPFVFVHFYP
jgi:hypothetical protein